MDTFNNNPNPDIHEAQFNEDHSTPTRDISPMEILNLANLITQVVCIQYD